MSKSPHLKRSGDRPLIVMFGFLTYFNRHTIYEQFVPLAIGMIAQYAKKQFGDDINVSLFKSIDKFLDKAVQNITKGLTPRCSQTSRRTISKVRSKFDVPTSAKVNST